MFLRFVPEKRDCKGTHNFLIDKRSHHFFYYMCKNGGMENCLRSTIIRSVPTFSFSIHITSVSKDEFVDGGNVGGVDRAVIIHIAGGLICCVAI